MTRSKKILNIATAIVVGLLVACTAASFLIRARTQPKVETVQPTQYSFALGEEWVDVLTVPRNAVLSESIHPCGQAGSDDRIFHYPTRFAPTVSRKSASKYKNTTVFSL